MQILAVTDNFPPRFYEELARLVVAFGRIEYLMKLCVKDLLAEGFTKGMAEAESQRQFSKLCAKSKKHASLKLTQMQANAFSGLIDQAEHLADFRNDLVHAFWTTNSDGRLLRIRPKWDKAKQTADWSASRNVLESEIQIKREQLEYLYQTLEAERKTWRTSATWI